MFLNFTNHPADTWSADQRRAAQQYGPIADMPFPDVPPALSAAETAALADVWAARILDLHPACVLCQGEMTLTFRVVRLLQAQGRGGRLQRAPHPVPYRCRRLHPPHVGIPLCPFPRVPLNRFDCRKEVTNHARPLGHLHRSVPADPRRLCRRTGG